jgi:hypothetical protein
VTQEDAIRLFEYRDGTLYWRERGDVLKQCNSKHAGKQAGCPSGHGYIKVRFSGRSYYAHQIVFLMHHGYIPDVVDHIDCDTGNNDIENLRAASKSFNGMNRDKPKSNTSGVKGVVWHKGGSKWMARVTVAGRDIYLGLYADFADAVNAANAARIEKHGDFARI